MTTYHPCYLVGSWLSPSHPADQVLLLLIILISHHHSQSLIIDCARIRIYCSTTILLRAYYSLRIIDTVSAISCNSEPWYEKGSTSSALRSKVGSPLDIAVRILPPDSTFDDSLKLFHSHRHTPFTLSTHLPKRCAVEHERERSVCGSSDSDRRCRLSGER